MSKELENGVELLITIKKLENGEVETFVQSKDKIDISNLLGVLEFAKSDFMIDHKNRQNMKKELDSRPKVKVVLEEYHFELLPSLKSEGYKKGDEYEMPDLIYNNIKEILKNKS